MKRAFAALLAFVVPGTALAGSVVTSQDIIDHFTGLEKPGVEATQKTRGIALPRGSMGSERSVYIGAAGFGLEGEQAAGGDSQPAGTGADPGAYDLLVEFDLDSAALRAEARSHLDAFVEALQSPALSDYRFLVEGHTDAIGPADYNRALSERRAAAVVDYLVTHGIDPARLTAQGFGETRPRATDPSDPANRRVETRLMP
jgi:outer membrane protein OmpA-like peptidoglycan-associated protein